MGRTVLPDRLNLCSWFLDARVTEGMGGRTAIRAGSRATTYVELARMSAHYAALLDADQVRPEERVIVALPDTPEFVAALLGILRHGAVAVMVNPDAPADLLRYFFEYTGATAAFVPFSRVDEFRHAASTCVPAVGLYAVRGAAGGTSGGVTGSVIDGAIGSTVRGGDLESRLASLPDQSSQRRAFDSHRDDAAIWLFSGGTTGRPKAVVQSHRSFAGTAELYGWGVLGLRPDDITISVPKLFFGYATGSNLFFPFSVGASCVLFPERCTPEVLFEQVRRHRPTILVNVPAMVQRMVAHPAAAEQDLSCLRLATSAGEALPVELHERWMRAFGVELLDGLGTSEMGHIFVSNRPGDVVPGTLGRAVPGFDVRLCDADGGAVADGEVGELWVRGDSRAIGYWQRADDTRRAFRGEWYVSGDMLRRNADGTLVYCGRGDDMLKVNGQWLAPGEIEHCLLAHPAVREVAVVGVKNADGLIKPRAFVVCETAWLASASASALATTLLSAPQSAPWPMPAAALAEELQVFARSRLEAFKCPREVIVVAALPRTHLGKVDRGLLARTREQEA